MNTKTTFDVEYKEEEEWLIWQSGFDSQEEALDVSAVLSSIEEIRIVEVKTIRRVVPREEITAGIP